MQRLILFAAAALPLLGAMPLSVHAQDLPKRKAGLWELRTVGVGSGTNVAKTCIGADDKILTPSEGNCGEPKVSSGGEDTIIIDVVCKSGDSKETISGAFTGDFNTRYRAQVKMTFDPPPSGMPPHIGVTIDGTYLGPDCSAANKP